MKQILALFLYYLGWHGFIRWLVRVGLVLVAVAIVGAFFSTNFAFGAAIYAYICIFALPLLMLPGPFRNLITNQRLGLVPGFRLRAGLALLLLTLLASGILQAITFILAVDALPPWTAFYFFTAASGYTCYMQWAITSRHTALLMPLGAWFIALFILYMKRLGWGVLEQHLELLVPGFLAALAGWSYALYVLATRDRFDNAFRFWQSGKEPLRRIWALHDRHPEASTPAGTLLLGMPDGTRQCLLVTVWWIIYIPLFVASILHTFNLLGAGDALPPFLWTFLTTSAFLGGCQTISSGEFAARTRLLWLRFGSDRVNQWRHLERILWHGLLVMYGLALATALGLAALGQLNAVLLVNYVFFIIAVSLYFLYFSLLCRIMDWPNPVKGLFIVLSLALLIFVTSRSFNFDSFTTLNGLEIIALLAAGLMRSLAHSRFLGIDWYRVQPINLRRIYGDK